MAEHAFVMGSAHERALETEQTRTPLATFVPNQVKNLLDHIGDLTWRHAGIDRQ